MNYSKVLLRAAPINLTDGDVIGVKSRQDDPEARDDFSTTQVRWFCCRRRHALVVLVRYCLVRYCCQVLWGCQVLWCCFVLTGLEPTCGA